MLKRLAFVFVICLPALAFAQDKEIDLANEYYSNGEYEKAISIYSNITKERQFVFTVHKNYLDALLKLEKFDETEKYLKRQLRNFPNESLFQVDYGVFLIMRGKKEEAEKHFAAYIETLKKDDAQIRYAARNFINANLYDYAEQLYLAGRKNGNDKFTYELASLYAMAGKTDMMITEYLDILKDDEEQLEYIENIMQARMREEEDFAKIEPVIFKFIQRYPDKVVYNEMLVWFYVQMKNFSKAFFQAKSVDKRKKLEGSGIYDIGNLAMENKDYENAIKIFEFLVERYRKESIYVMARRQLVKAKEELVKNTFPVDIEKIKSLVKDYQQIIGELGLVDYTAEAARSMALLQAFYLNNKDTAIKVFEEIINKPTIRKDFTDQVKLDLGDIYLLKNEPWESTLLYSQVEKRQKEKDLGHLAKLKNAKLSYYKGDFELAKENLDVLKLATSREIANDAMQLSLLIGDNIALDTTEAALKEYASIDLLVFQGQLENALERYKAMQKQFSYHPIVDEILWAKANIYLKLGKFEQAIDELTKIIEEHNDDIWADDANFLIAKIYDENLKNKDKAMEYYQKQLTDYQGSIYSLEARKRYRQLRGDNVN
ncbi:tetratricopeptide repeat protein [Thermoflexibacter ruber]|uniref:Tetratricopeptide repeat-containing protein n=1 Tax=Thermoflexibacter ruber TaxID=1003 RepID=A0A1I2F376_9BACT|nr:tetratricopeptide repeat protein [Thermoflexibacter ruber]SFE99158.1 Tetratricopeptide repeat-containing protein [Thermoflexibacter ruber]